MTNEQKIIELEVQRDAAVRRCNEAKADLKVFKARSKEAEDLLRKLWNKLGDAWSDTECISECTRATSDIENFFTDNNLSDSLYDQ